MIMSLNPPRNQVKVKITWLCLATEKSPRFQGSSQETPDSRSLLQMNWRIFLPRTWWWSSRFRTWRGTKGSFRRRKTTGNQDQSSWWLWMPFDVSMMLWSLSRGGRLRRRTKCLHPTRKASRRSRSNWIPKLSWVEAFLFEQKNKSQLKATRNHKWGMQENRTTSSKLTRTWRWYTSWSTRCLTSTISRNLRKSMASNRLTYRPSFWVSLLTKSHWWRWETHWKCTWTTWCSRSKNTSNWKRKQKNWTKFLKWPKKCFTLRRKRKRRKKTLWIQAWKVIKIAKKKNKKMRLSNQVLHPPLLKVRAALLIGWLW